MTKFSNKSKKTFLAHFGPIFPILREKKNCPENLALSRTTSHGIIAPCQNLEKIKDTIPRKQLGRQEDRWKDGRTEVRMDGRTDGQILFCRTLLTIARVPKRISMQKSQGF